MWQNCTLISCKLELIIFILFALHFVANKQVLNQENEDLFKRLFKIKRADHLEAVKNIKKLNNDKQLKMMKTLSKTIFDVILKSRVVLENSGFTPGVSEFPEKEEIRDALSLILENTALMGEMVLRLPDVADTVLRSSPEWPVLLAWSLAFSNQTLLLDTASIKLVDLVSQELNLTTRSPDYINPYRPIKEKAKDKLAAHEEVKKKKKKKDPVPRGPRLSLPQTGEL